METVQQAIDRGVNVEYVPYILAEEVVNSRLQPEDDRSGHMIVTEYEEALLTLPNFEFKQW